MARIPKHELDELKRHVSLLSLAQSQGHKFKKHGADSYVCLCPFHDEKTPSCVITPAKGLYHCFGCGAKGSVIDWQMHTTGQGLREAVAFLKARLAGADDNASSLTVPPGKPEPTPARQLLVDLDVDGQALLRQVTDFYHRNLLDSPEAQAWLVHRGLNHPELVSHFRLGFAGAHGISGEAGLLPSTSSKEGRRLRARLASLGVLREKPRQDHFRGCVTVPVEGWSESAIVTHRGRMLQLYGRRTLADSQIKKGSPRHLYLPSPLCGVWNEAAMQNASDLILCESLIDAMTFWCAGLRNVTTAYGVNGFTADHLAALRYHGVKRVLIAYDRDEAGDRGAERVADELLACGLEAWRVPFPAGMDANEYALKSGNPEPALGLALQQARWLGSGNGPGVVFSHESPPSTASVATTAPDNSPSLAVPAPVPSASTTDTVAHEVNASGDLQLTCGPRVWRVRGWQKQRQPETMKVSVQIRDSLTGAFHVDSLDMYHARSRQSYVSTAATELACEQSVIKRECGHLLLLLEQKQDEAREAETTDNSTAVTMNADDEAAALELLKSPDLTARITDDLAACGVVGESTNLLTGYLAAVSRKLDKPLAVLIQSSSAAGKSSLMDAVLGLMPDEERVQY
ncbi:TPA: CHC2 zinc finger domain-containing protein, partial [Escherichia coli]